MNPTLAEFDALMSEIREERINRRLVRKAFNTARGEYNKAHPGKKFLFTIDEAE